MRAAIIGGMAARDVGGARQALETQINEIGWLRGTGPNPFEYGLWDERTREVLEGVWGAGSAEVASYEEAAGKRGRLPGVRGQAENMTLNIHGPWGILSRLARAEPVLRELVASLPAPPEPSATAAADAHD